MYLREACRHEVGHIKIPYNIMYIHVCSCSDLSATRAKIIFPYDYNFGLTFDQVGTRSSACTAASMIVSCAV